MNQPIYKRVTVARDAADLREKNQIRIVVSDETLDHAGHIIRQKGWRLGTYQKNPVVQNNHNRNDIRDTIAKAVRTEIIGPELIQTWQFAVEENPVARIGYEMYKGGFLRAASVGFIPHAWNPGKPGTDVAIEFTDQELLEVSAVGIPENPNALINSLFGKSTAEIDQILRKFAKALPREGATDPLLMAQTAELINKINKLLRK